VCTTCPIFPGYSAGGATTLEEGSTSARKCIPCPGGTTFSSGRCAPCPPGTYNGDTASTCKPVNPGTYTDEPGSTRAKGCPK
jgi:hypothetical protein